MYFIRKDTSVELLIDSKLGTCKPMFPFTFHSSSQEFAELIKNQMNKVMTEFKHNVATRPWIYLDPYEISDLKRELSKWSVKEGTWKNNLE